MEISCSIRPAIQDDAAVLTDIAVKAKGHWGYSEDQLAHWKRKVLTISPKYIAANHVWVANLDSRPIAFAAIIRHGTETILDHLWVLPEYIGKGIGKKLFGHVVNCVGGMNCREFQFTADPHADGFYYRMGAEKIGDHHTGFQQRVLTKFRYRIQG